MKTGGLTAARGGNYCYLINRQKVLFLQKEECNNDGNEINGGIEDFTVLFLANNRYKVCD